MSSETKSWSQRSDLFGILILMAIPSLLLFFIPIPQIIYLGDLYIALAMILSSIFILKTEEDYNKQVKSILIVILFGGLLTSIELTSLVYFLAKANNLGVENLIQFFIEWAILIYLTIFLIGGCFLLYRYMVIKSEEGNLVK